MTSFSIKRASPVKAGLAAVMLSSLGVFQSAYALGTAAGTDITNTATVNYTVGSVAQTAVNSNTTTFEVDRKVDFTVSGVTATTTAPGATNVGVIYTVSNTGNGPDSFTFTAANQGSDDFDVTNLRVYRDNGTTANVFDGGDTLITAGTPVSFTADESINFFIVSDIPLTPINGHDSVVRLTATTTSTATVGADNPAVVDVVFADAGTNGTEFDDNQYDISSATLSVVKSASIISDPINGTGANRKAIPGAEIQYTIVVTNSGAANATAVALSDNIPANTTYVPASMTLNAAALTDAGLDDAGTFTGTAVNIDAGTVNSGGGTATVTFRVVIVN
jgi:uncharacterized repeat protein (TIGR01451 family)